MKTLQLPQGSAAWHDHRRVHKNASDASAMMGCSPYKTRTALLLEKKTGIVAEVDVYQQRAFDEGHRTEALARPLAEKIMGEDLYPVVGTNGDLSASYDGLTMMETRNWEHKMLNVELRECMTPECNGLDLPLYHQIQMEQQCIVAEDCEEVLFMASEWDGDTLVEERHCWYKPNPDLAARIVAGWAQFDVDLAAYVPEAPKVDVIGKLMESLPALNVTLEGRVVASNLAPFRQAATAALANIKTELKTDQDFADAVEVIKFCEDGEKRFEVVKEQALSQTESIDELFRTIDAISAEMRTKRLALTKAVDTRKLAIRVEIINESQAALDEHRNALNTRLGSPWLAHRAGNFGDAIKGKRTVASCRDAASVALANLKIDMSATADRLDLNRKALRDANNDKDWFFLFADFATVGTKPVEDFAAIAAQRIQKHKDEEQAAADRAAAAAAAKPAEAVVTAIAPAPAPPPAAAPIAVRYGRAPVAPLAGIARPVVDNRPPITTGALCEFLQFTVNADFVKRLGVTPATNPAGAKSGTYWNVRDVPAIKSAIVRHLNALPDAPVAAAAREAVPA